MLKQYSKPILSFLLAFLITMASMIIGLKFLPAIPAWGAALGLILPLLLALSSALMYRSIKKEMEMKDVAAYQKKTQESIQDVRQRYDEYQKQIRGEIRLLQAWAGLCGLAGILQALLYGMASKNNQPPATIFLILALYILFSFCSWLIPDKQEEANEQECLKESQYPAIYQLAREVFGQEQKLTIMKSMDPTVGINIIQDRIYLFIGVIPGITMTREEMKQVLLHEKGHMEAKKNDPQLLGQKILYRNKIENDKGGLRLLGNILLYGPMLRLDYTVTLSERNTSFVKEQRADQYAVDHGNASVFASALAKVHMFSIYEYFDHDDRVEDYRNETPLENYATLLTDSFVKCARRRQNIWTDMIMNELPARVSSHPSFPERLASIGNPAFSVDWTGVRGEAKDEKSLAYNQDMMKYLSAVDQELLELQKEDYQERRLKKWIRPQKLIREYDEAKAAGEKWTTLQLRPVLDACVTCHDYKHLEIACQDAIAHARTSSESSHAKYLLGALYLSQYNKKGIDLIYEAMEDNHNYQSEGFDLIGRFCLQMNLPDELEEYRRRAEHSLQNYIDQNEEDLNRLNKGDKLSIENTLPKEQQEINIRTIQEICGSGLRNLYQIHKEVSGNLHTTAYVLDFDQTISEKEKDEKMEQVFQYLDNEPDQYSLYDRNNLNSFKDTDLAPFLCLVSDTTQF